MLSNEELKAAVKEGLKRAIYKRVAKRVNQDRGMQDILDAHVSAMCLNWKFQIDQEKHQDKKAKAHDNPASADSQQSLSH